MGLVMSMICVVVPQVRLYLAKIYKIYADYTPIIYPSDDQLTPVSRRRLNLVGKKTLVLDMDETLMTSWMKKHGKDPKNRPTMPKISRYLLYCILLDTFIWMRSYDL